MHLLDKRSLVLGLRWSVVAFLLIGLGLLVWSGESQLDRISKTFCPQGWWHTGLYWAHCAYPPISIFKYGVMYAGYAVLALLVIHLAAPAGKLLASRFLLLALALPPLHHLVALRFSWVEACKLFIVAVVGLIFIWRTNKPPTAPG